MTTEEEGDLKTQEGRRVLSCWEAEWVRTGRDPVIWGNSSGKGRKPTWSPGVREGRRCCVAYIGLLFRIVGTIGSVASELERLFVACRVTFAHGVPWQRIIIWEVIIVESFPNRLAELTWARLEFISEQFPVFLSINELSFLFSRVISFLPRVRSMWKWVTAAFKREHNT